MNPGVETSGERRDESTLKGIIMVAPLLLLAAEACLLTYRGCQRTNIECYRELNRGV